MSVIKTFNRLFRSFYIYKNTTPSYSAVQKLFQNQLQIDHIAFRSIKGQGGLDTFRHQLTNEGIYTYGGSLKFHDQPINAEWFYTEHMIFSSISPRIFVSELDETCLSINSQGILNKYLINTEQIIGESGFDVNIDCHDYADLQNESEYAAWVLMNGNRINHTALSTLSRMSIYETLDALEDNKFNINTDGGKIKISDDKLLKQLSLNSDLGNYVLSQESVQLPACFVELIHRGTIREGALRGFVRDGFDTHNAMDIFKSTNIHS